MPKKSRRPKARAKSKSKRKNKTTARHSLTARRLPPRVQARTDDEAHVDGCDVDFHESDSTPDSELPQARGGVETVRRTGRRGR
jgi:hypothetical protein